MIAYLPQFYPDELIYSWVCRIYCHNGYLKSREALNDVLEPERKRLTFLYSGCFNTDIVVLLKRMFESLEKMVELHTILPYFILFDPPSEKKAMLRVHGSCGLRSIRKPSRTIDFRCKYLMYCPECAKDDRMQYGETYYHREHQITDVNTCIKHKCYLANSGVRISNRQPPDLCIANVVIPETQPALQADNFSLAYSAYLISLFQHPITYQDYVPVGKFLRNRLPEKYILHKEMNIDFNKLAEDMLKYYKPIGLSILPYFFLGYIIKGYNRDTRFICLLAYFLGISVEELIHLPKQDTNFDLYMETERDEYF